jgi:hypothetical protein
MGWKLVRVGRVVVLTALVAVVVSILRTAPAPEVRVDASAPDRLDHELFQLAKAREEGQPHTVVLDEAELNSLLTTNLATARDDTAGDTPSNPSAPQADESEPTLEEVQSNVRDVRVNLVDDRIRGYVLFHAYGRDLSLTLEGRLGVADGYLHLEPTLGRLGTLPIPQAALDGAVRRVFDSPQNRERLRVPPDLEDVRVENGELKLDYR